jgi:hypothetical protein
VKSIAFAKQVIQVLSHNSVASCQLSVAYSVHLGRINQASACLLRIAVTSSYNFSQQARTPVWSESSEKRPCRDVYCVMSPIRVHPFMHDTLQTAAEAGEGILRVYLRYFGQSTCLMWRPRLNDDLSFRSAE